MTEKAKAAGRGPQLEETVDLVESWLSPRPNRPRVKPRVRVHPGHRPPRLPTDSVGTSDEAALFSGRK